jgi:hypothetical protein
MNGKSAVTLLMLSSVILAACAEAPERILPSSVSPVLYGGLDCRTLQVESKRIDDRLSVLTERQHKAANQDTSVAAFSFFLFWPAAFFIGREDYEVEIARLKGEAEAVSNAAVSKECQHTRTLLGAPISVGK